MRKLLLIIFASLLSINSYCQCAGITSKQPIVADNFKSCTETVVGTSTLNTVNADTVSVTKLTVTNLTDGLIKSVGDVLTPAVAGTDYTTPAQLDSAVAVKDAMNTLVIGNSIAVQSKFDGGTSSWRTNSDVHYANALAGSPMIFQRTTATTRMDGYCVYGYSGQTSATILGDLQSQVFTQLQASNIKIDCVWGHSLLENDVATGVTVATMQLSITRFIRDIRARFPGVIIILSTPRPSFSYNTGTLVSNYQSIVAWLQTLDNSKDIFVTTLNAYEDPGSPAVPLSGYTDATVHPNAKGALLLARTEAATFKRIGKIWKQPYFAVSSNMALTGTAAASGTNVSGTVPTSTTITGSANGTFIGTAEQPGFTEEIQLPVDTTVGAFLDLSSTNFGSVSVTTNNGFQYSAFITIEIISGAQNINNIDFWARAADGSGNPFKQYISSQTGDARPDWVNGDILTFVMPPQVAVTAPITGINNYILCKAALIQDGNGFKFRVINQGVGLFQQYVKPNFITNTATLNFGSTAAGAATDLTMTVTGAVSGDVCAVGIPSGSSPTNGAFSCWVSAADTVTVRFINPDVLNPMDPASGTFRVSVIKY